MESAMNMLLVVLLSVAVAVVLGTLFAFAYPTVEIDLALASLFALCGLLVVLSVRSGIGLFRRKRE